MKKPPIGRIIWIALLAVFWFAVMRHNVDTGNPWELLGSALGLLIVWWPIDHLLSGGRRRPPDAHPPE